MAKFQNYKFVQRKKHTKNKTFQGFRNIEHTLYIDFESNLIGSVNISKGRSYFNLKFIKTG